MEKPYSVIPYPVAFWKLHEKWDEKVELITYDGICIRFLNKQQVLE
jgi:hypothetical protein